MITAQLLLNELNQRTLTYPAQTCAPKKYRQCRWGAERRVKRAQTPERGPPSALMVVMSCSRPNIRKGTKRLSSMSRTRKLFLHAVMVKTSRQSVFQMYIMHGLIYFGHISRNSSNTKEDFFKTNTLITSEVPQFCAFWRLSVLSSVFVLVLSSSSGNQEMSLSSQSKKKATLSQNLYSCWWWLG